MGGLQGWHLVIIIVLAIVLFGAPKLPGMARSIGQSLRIFKSEVQQMKDENNTDRAPGAGPVEGRVMDNPQQPYNQQPYNPVRHDDPTGAHANPPTYRADGSSQAADPRGTSHQNGNSPTNP